MIGSKWKLDRSRLMAWACGTLAIVALPGLVQLPAMPAEAAPREIKLDTPVQQWGQATPLPHLGDSAVVPEAREVRPADRPVPKGALETDSRSLAVAGERRLPESKEDKEDDRLPSGVRRAEEADRKANDDAPFIEDVYPEDMAFVSAQPRLVVEATRFDGGTQESFRFFFKVCNKSDMTGDCITSPGTRGQNVWQVPAGALEWGKEYWWQVRVTDPERGTQTYTDIQSFTTGVRQPTVTSQLGVRGASGQEFQHVSGNYTTEFVDAKVAAPGPPLSVVRTYNSLNPRTDGIFGAGWSTRWDMKIVPETVDGIPSLLVTYPDGQQVRFADRGDGTFQPPPGHHATLAAVEGGGWRLMDKSSTTYVFDAQGRPTQVVDARGRSQTMHYGDDGKLVKVTATGGRSLHFTWDGPAWRRCPPIRWMGRA